MFNKIISSEKINRTSAKTPIILISGNPNRLEKAAKLQDLGLVDWFEKPFDFDEFHQAISKLFENKPKEKTILIVDDNPGVIKCNVRVVDMICPNSTILSAASAAEALKLLGKQKFDFILTDLEMPGMNGDEMILKIRRGEY